MLDQGTSANSNNEYFDPYAVSSFVGHAPSNSKSFDAAAKRGKKGTGITIVMNDKLHLAGTGKLESAQKIKQDYLELLKKRQEFLQKVQLDREERQRSKSKSSLNSKRHSPALDQSKKRLQSIDSDKSSKKSKGSLHTKECHQSVMSSKRTETSAMKPTKAKKNFSRDPSIDSSIKVRDKHVQISITNKKHEYIHKKRDNSTIKSNARQLSISPNPAGLMAPTITQPAKKKRKAALLNVKTRNPDQFSHKKA